MTGGANDSCIAYERIADLTAAMLEAARAAQWDRLLQLEDECREVFSGLTTVLDSPSSAPGAQRRKAALIQQVLADDAEIRKLVEPWVAELGQWLGVNTRNHRLRDTYSAGG
ncbi:MAG: flagellar protein FliT [Burkholderiales bacterium]|nr:flagellar protein FliT [Burkholderiales bacterium]MDP2399253.1 flagellar protein FliT [Burkholderiales bacterium]